MTHQGGTWAGWVPGIDWSDYQPTLDFAALIDGGVRYGWRKAGQGLRYRQRWYDHDVAAANAAGFAMGAYWWPELHLTRSARIEAEQFARVTTGFRGLALPPVLDIEDQRGVPSIIDVFGRGGAAELVAELAERVEALSGRTPVIYCSGTSGPGSVWEPPRECLLRFPAWVPHYGTQRDYNTQHGPDFRPTWSFRAPRGMHEPVAVQHSAENGRAPGVAGPVDLNLIDGEWLATLTAGTPHTTRGGLTVAEADRIMRKLDEMAAQAGPDLQGVVAWTLVGVKQIMAETSAQLIAQLAATMQQAMMNPAANTPDQLVPRVRDAVREALDGVTLDVTVQTNDQGGT